MLMNAEQLAEDVLMAPCDTLFGSISGTFDHILVVAEIFRAPLEGRVHPHQARSRAAPLAFRDVAQRLRAMNTHYVDLAEQWSAADLAQVIRFDFIGGGSRAMTRWDILQHLVNHATHHRGFVSTLPFPHRIDLAPNDLTVFLRNVWPGLAETPSA
ncbi:DinB family protein [Roseobacter sinensis]|uniref:DinB family protein n=1 Tax=Roseobacter sinensis TaxID=2931391 RepID=A0ABT3BGX4_9RHOB|nr:DinB family protein [Roseobacter sp. WL0113]MCV3272821.1 DinB family protein [Roseobacter sp. WL0113]